MQLENIKNQDPQIAEAIKKELIRQQHVIELIPSENFVSRAVLEALGTVLTNKYSEGYPGNRYYGGTENVDIIEQLAIDRARSFFRLNMLMFNHYQALRPTLLLILRY